MISVNLYKLFISKIRNEMSEKRIKNNSKPQEEFEIRALFYRMIIDKNSYRLKYRFLVKGIIPLDKILITKKKKYENRIEMLEFINKL